MTQGLIQLYLDSSAVATPICFPRRTILGKFTMLSQVAAGAAAHSGDVTHFVLRVIIGLRNPLAIKPAFEHLRSLTVL